MITFFAPASMCFCAVSLVRNRPVASTTTSAPTALHLRLAGIPLLRQADPLAVDEQRVAVDRDLALEAAVHRVVLQHVGEVLGLEQVVDGDDLDLVEVLHGGAKHHAPDAAEAVDADLDGHCGMLLDVKE